MIAAALSHGANRMDELAKRTAELALRLVLVSGSGGRPDLQILDAVEQTALLVLKEAAACRVSAARPVGETTGMFRVPAVRPY
jgi:hypothetical protein